MARGLKFLIQKVEGLYYPCSENKGADQLRIYCEVDLRIFFPYAKSHFSQDAAQRAKIQGELSFTPFARLMTCTETCF